MSQSLVPTDNGRRSIVRFPVSSDPWPTITSWAYRQRYGLRSDQGSTKLYQRGIGLLVAPMRAQFTYANGQLEVQAWIHNFLFTRLMTLFILPQEMSVRSGGLRAVVPRNMARGYMNDLLQQFGAPLIT